MPKKLKKDTAGAKPEAVKDKKEEKEIAKKVEKPADAKKEGDSKKRKFEDKAPRDLSHLFSKKPKSFSLGADIPPKKDLTRVLKWPKYIRLQRKVAILKKRLKIPPAINQFCSTLAANHAKELFKLLVKYAPETPEQKSARLKVAAQAQADKKPEEPSAKPKVVKYGLNHVTTLVEQKKAKLVVIAHDVDPIELVVWLPALCRKMEVPYCIVKGKARLGTVVHQDTAAAVCLTEVKKEDQHKLDSLVEVVTPLYNKNASLLRWGGGILGSKARARIKAGQKANPPAVSAVAK
jgi:large subunit ribosomal protein L7Ae